MLLQMNIDVAVGYKSNSQRARVVTEQWLLDNMFCPRCGNNQVSHFENNRPVADFFCPSCNNQYELKSISGANLNKINDGAYSTMIDRIMSMDSPDFFFMSYLKPKWTVYNLFFVPKHFFTPSIISKKNLFRQMLGVLDGRDVIFSYQRFRKKEEYLLLKMEMLHQKMKL